MLCVDFFNTLYKLEINRTFIEHAKKNAIKKLTYENIYSLESGGLQIISNHLIDDKEFEKISKKFFNLKSNKDKSTFLYSKVDIKDENSNKIEYFSNLQDLNFLIKNIL